MLAKFAFAFRNCRIAIKYPERSASDAVCSRAGADSHKLHMDLTKRVSGLFRTPIFLGEEHDLYTTYMR